jgi:hypothetical protein
MAALATRELIRTAARMRCKMDLRWTVTVDPLPKR